MKNILKISAAAFSILLGSCIKDVTPTEIATEDQVTLETLVGGIPAALVKPGSTGYKLAWDFALPAIHLATESMTGDIAITGNIGYDWFQQWGANDALGPEYAVGALPWNNYYTWIMMANNVISLIDETDIATLGAKERSYLGFAYAYRAMFYLDLVRLYEFKENTVTRADDLLGLGVPIVLPETTEAQAKNNPRATVDEIYDSVIFPDLEKAGKLLENFTAPDKYTISLALVYGLKARAYLERGTDKNDAAAYRSAAEYARKAITASGRTPLTQEEWEDPANGFNNAESNNAWIWGLALPSESVANLMCFTVHMSCENDWAPYHAGRAINRNLYNSIYLRDFRRHSWLDPDRGSYSYKSCRPDGKEYFAEKLADYVNIKFRPAQGAYKDFKVGGAADHCCMRVEEMYFIEAEATAQAGDVQGGHPAAERVYDQIPHDGRRGLRLLGPIDAQEFRQRADASEAYRILGRGHRHVRHEASGHVQQTRIRRHERSGIIPAQRRRPRSVLEFCDQPRRDPEQYRHCQAEQSRPLGPGRTVEGLAGC